MKDFSTLKYCGCYNKIMKALDKFVTVYCD